MDELVCRLSCWLFLNWMSVLYLAEAYLIATSSSPAWLKSWLFFCITCDVCIQTTTFLFWLPALYSAPAHTWCSLHCCMFNIQPTYHNWSKYVLCTRCILLLTCHYMSWGRNCWHQVTFSLILVFLHQLIRLQTCRWRHPSVLVPPGTTEECYEESVCATLFTFLLSRHVYTTHCEDEGGRCLETRFMG